MIMIRIIVDTESERQWLDAVVLKRGRFRDNPYILKYLGIDVGESMPVQIEKSGNYVDDVKDKYDKLLRRFEGIPIHQVENILRDEIRRNEEWEMVKKGEYND